MKHLWILAFLLSAQVDLFAQKNGPVLTTSERIKTNPADTVHLTLAQQKWFDSNHKMIAGLKKDSVSKLARKRFPAITEASIEYMIGMAGKLASGDQAAQLAKLQAALEQLKKQKQSLADKIAEKEKQLGEETEMGKKAAIERDITKLKKKYSDVEDQIRNTEERKRQIGDDD